MRKPTVEKTGGGHHAVVPAMACIRVQVRKEVEEVKPAGAAIVRMRERDR